MEKMSEQEKIERCYACGKMAVISYSGSGKNPICMECHTELDKHMAENEWMPTDKEMDRWCDEFEKEEKEEREGREGREGREEREEAERKFTIWKERLTKQFDIFKDEFRPLF